MLLRTLLRETATAKPRKWHRCTAVVTEKASWWHSARAFYSITSGFWNITHLTLPQTHNLQTPTLLLDSSYRYLYTKREEIKHKTGAGPVAKWLGLHALLRRPRILLVQILDVDMWICHCSSSHAEASSHMAQLEGPTTRIYNYLLGDFREKKKEKKKEKKIGNRY